MSRKPNLATSRGGVPKVGVLQWSRDPAGTWLAETFNEYSDCDLFGASMGEKTVYVHRTSDGKDWVRLGDSSSQRFKTRREAFFAEPLKRSLFA